MNKTKSVVVVGLVVILGLIFVILADHLTPKAPIYLSPLAAGEVNHLLITLPCNRLYSNEVGLRFSPPFTIPDLQARVFRGTADFAFKGPIPGPRTSVSREIRKFFAQVDPPKVDSVTLFEIEPEFRLLCSERTLDLTLKIEEIEPKIATELYISRARRP